MTKPPRTEMMPPPKTDQFFIEAVWGPNHETPGIIAKRFVNLLDRLEKIDPLFGNWLWVANMEAIRFDQIRNDLPGAIAAKIARDDDGDPIPICGYRFSVINSEESSPRSIAIRVHAGSWTNTPYGVNDVVLETSWRIIPDPRIRYFSDLESCSSGSCRALRCKLVHCLPRRAQGILARSTTLLSSRMDILCWIAIRASDYAALDCDCRAAPKRRPANGRDRRDFFRLESGSSRRGKGHTSRRGTAQRIAMAA